MVSDQLWSEFCVDTTTGGKAVIRFILSIVARRSANRLRYGSAMVIIVPEFEGITFTNWIKRIS